MALFDFIFLIPEVVPIEKSVAKSPARSKDDLALDNEINEAIEARNAAFARKSA